MTYLSTWSIEVSENRGVGASSNVVGIICPTGWDRVNWSAKILGVKAPRPLRFRQPWASVAGSYYVVGFYATWRKDGLVNIEEALCEIVLWIILEKKFSATFSQISRVTDNHQQPWLDTLLKDSYFHKVNPSCLRRLYNSIDICNLYPFS